ncbi:MAG: acyl carrier protein [Clostridia bacterium]|nr:acyl carrier protein [Clostridia bacterium]
MSTFKKACEIISEQLGLSADFDFSEETTWEEINADSLDLVEIVMSIEDEFQIEIDDDAVSSMRNMGDLVAYIEEEK